MPFSCDYQASTITPRVRGLRPVQDKTSERGRPGHTSQKSWGVLRIRASVTDLLSDPRSDTGGSVQVRGVATLQASPRIAHRLCLSSRHLNLQCNDSSNISDG
jgi:hypothetical protein